MSDSPSSSDENTEQPPELISIPQELITDDCIDISHSNNRSILKRIIKEGSGRQPLNGDKVYVHYTGTLPDGKQFDSSRDRDTHFTFDLGSGKVIKSWEICVRSMKRGEECMLLTSAKYGYGKNGHADIIPPNSALCFKIELLDFHGEDVTPEKNGLLMRSIISKGSGYLVPRDCAKVRISFVAKVNGEIIDQREDLDFEVGKAEDLNLAEGIDLAVRSMRNGEQSLFVAKYPLSCRVYETDDISHYSPDHHVEYIITMKEFTEVKQPYEMECDQKLDMAVYIKERGNHLLKLQCYNAALRWYVRGMEYLEDWDVTPDSKIPAEQLGSRNQFMTSLHLNISLAQLKLCRYKETISSADEACKIDAMSYKAHLRAAKAYCELTEFDLALERLNLAKECGADSQEVKREVKNIQRMRQAYKEKERSIFKNVFDKLAVNTPSNGS